ncbi:CAP-Gly domain-containing protein [Drepanopeziza brunnea f. sp. 'multigermtubi' MB_m1]|uniref:CAP-Gly domain-containing protein n=1 Tax=Marssonina brunnea f. sp. multigermtubi (strain MB_m1) TaxID=1072389 RepID=K1X2R7_MARBU|nr:CAP-Gly domain-containing protein [Drepanopeziza brunnea f. sp. 'multigermtubi' MB_m1]EKD19312.1 CAP-Gly domain-containing protein [Drepanopeziza brunnea f. sp. 'multigermtubi' MB_m1]
MSTYNPRRSLARPRPSILNGINASSSPNLSGLYNAHQTKSLVVKPHAPLRKASANALTSSSLALIPDASGGYTLSSALDVNSQAVKMPPLTPSRAGGEDLEVGDIVDVPGSMYGTVKFVGTVQGKKGTFAGVELSEEFAARGKNSGDVDGWSRYLSSDKQGNPTGVSFVTRGLLSYHTNDTFNRRELQARPSIGTPSKAPSRYGSPAPGKFGQSVRGTQDSRDPSKKPVLAPRNGMKMSVGPRSASALGQVQTNYGDEETTPVGPTRTATNGSISSNSSYNVKLRPASRTASRNASRANNDDELDKLRGQLEERDRQLRDQASSLAEMENSLVEVQALMSSPEVGGRQDRGSVEGKDASQLRAILREKNEKIAMLTAEFDAHRADFRSTIDTLELASTETERVYEKRVEDLLQEVRELAERSEDVDSVAQQLKQLEELVQELEEGLEDARRGEAEARGEVEFLRGEVERTRSELRRERDKATATMIGGATGDSGDPQKIIAQRDDEIRGLKAIIHSLSRDAIPDMGSPNGDPQKTPTNPTRHGSSQCKPSNGGLDSLEDRVVRERLEREVAELRATVEAKVNREDELEREVERLRRGSASNGTSQRASATSTGTATQDQASAQDSKGTIVSWRDRDTRASTESHKRGNTLETMPESDTYSSANESFCELCETAGHDILTCTNMFSPNGATPPRARLRTGKDVVKVGLSPKPSHDEYKPAPLSPIKSRPSTNLLSEHSQPLPVVQIIPNPMASGPVAGKESGVVNMDKWCGVCERDGHDSIDCPFEDAF